MAKSRIRLRAGGASFRDTSVQSFAIIELAPSYMPFL
jgi:hypothetical protein